MKKVLYFGLSAVVFSLAVVIGCSNGLSLDDESSDADVKAVQYEAEEGTLVTGLRGIEILFPSGCGLNPDEMLLAAAEMTSAEGVEETVDLDAESNARIIPGETENDRVREGNYDNFSSSLNGLRTFEVWVRDPTTQVRAYWYEEISGASNWVFRGSELISGTNRRFSRTVYLARGENFKVRIKGVRQSPDSRLDFCRYSVACSKTWPYSTFNTAAYNPETWFKADDWVRWTWAGCATWLVVNDGAKQILLMDAYVSKATLGANHDYTMDPLERARIARLVNVLRGYAARKYRIEGVLTSHRHGDHIGDLPFILGGISAAADSNFLNSGVALTGDPYPFTVPVVMSQDTFDDPYYAASLGSAIFHRPGRDEVIIPLIYADGKVDGRAFKSGSDFSLGNFRITPFVWYHGKTGDGTDDSVRTLAYTVRDNPPPQVGTVPAKVFFTAGYVERSGQIREINEDIPCHHMIAGWGGDSLTAKSLSKVILLPSSPVGANYFFASHIDNNSNALYSLSSGVDSTTDFFGQCIQRGVVTVENRNVAWRGISVNLKLGVSASRIGDL